MRRSIWQVFSRSLLFLSARITNGRYQCREQAVRIRDPCTKGDGSYGFEGIQVDGNDIFAVYKATKDAIEKAKKGDGPTFIECFTYRMSHHTTADDATRYRKQEEVESWKAKDPLLRMKLYMGKKGIWTEQYNREVENKSKAAVDEAVKKAEATEPPFPGDMLTYTLKELTPRQAKQIRDF